MGMYIDTAYSGKVNLWKAKSLRVTLHPPPSGSCEHLVARSN
jgi:hypothetical protein